MTRTWTDDEKYERLMTLADDWLNCTRCQLHSTRLNVVFGRGSPTADYLFVGEGPGANEDEEGEPWVGAAGEVLEELIETAEIPVAQIFLTNIIGCRTPQNRDPQSVEVKACQPRLLETIYIIDPLLIIPVGKPAMKSLMGGSWQNITDRSGRFGTVEIPSFYHPQKLRYAAMPIVHPSFILRTDSEDPDTKVWREGGPFHETVRALEKAREVVQTLKEFHQKVTENFA